MFQYFKFTFLFMCSSAAFFSHGQNPNPNSTLDADIQAEMAAEEFPGAATIIVKDGKIIWVESYGFADVQNGVAVEDTTVFLLASLSKLFTGTASMHAAEAGIIDLDANINTYLPWGLQIPNHTNSPVTVRQLMTHTGSIDDNDAVTGNYYDYPDPTITLSTCMQRYFPTNGADYDAVNNFIDEAPGTEYMYSNMGTALNGYITEVASGVPFDTYCENNIFTPLCMEKTAWHFEDFDSAHVARPYSSQGGNYVAYPHYGFADYPNGQLRSNVIDLANFMIAYLNGGGFGPNAILSSLSINDMWTPQITSLEPEQGLNWYQEELFHDGGSSVLWGHNGGEDGVTTDLYVDPVNDIGICVLTNGEGDALSICDELYNFALMTSSASGILPDCIENASIQNNQGANEKEISKIIDLMGRETNWKPNTPLIIIYKDGSTERVIGLED